MIIGKDYQKKQIEKHQKFLLKLLHLHIGSYYPLRKYLGIDFKGRIDEITHLSIAYNTKHFSKGGKWYKQQTRTYQQPDLALKLNLILDKIPQLALLPTLLQPAYGLGALALFFLTQTTYQPSSKDNNIYGLSGYEDTNYGSATSITLYNPADPKRIILEFDTSDIPANATFTQGDLLLYYYNHASNDPVGISADMYKLTRTDWVELESTWNIYKTGSNWTTAGGDYVTTNPSGTTVEMPSSYGWVTWGIQAIVENAYGNSDNVELLGKWVDETGTQYVADFYSNDYTDDTSLRPKLTVTYTTPFIPKIIMF